MSRESVFSLKPRGIGELLDLTFRIYRHQFALFATVGVLIATLNTAAGVVMQLSIYSGDNPLDPNTDPTGFIIATYTALPIFFAFYLLVLSVGATVVFGVTRGLITGNAIGWKQSLAAGMKRLPAMFLTSILSWIAIMFGTLFCFLPGVAVAVLLALAVPVAFFEHRPPFSALGRSVELIRRRGPQRMGSDNNAVRVLVIGVVTLVVWYALNVFVSIPQAAAMYIGMAGRGLVMTPIGPAPLPMAWMLPLYFIGAMVQGLFLAIILIPWGVVYFDIRVQHEGLDMEEKIYHLRNQDRDGNKK